MVQAPRRTPLTGPTLVRLLARFVQADLRQPAAPLSDRLSEWVGWTDAITLSGVLKAAAPVGASVAPAAAGDDAQAASERVRAALTRAIAAATRPPPTRAALHATPAEAPADYADYADFRQRYQLLQQTMETDVGDLRQRLRATLAAAAPGLARLAGVDAVMERALAARERALLASVPALLGAHFERLRGAHPDAPANAWLPTFRHDMHSVLLAELEVRLQPVEGLLAALRAR